MNGPSQFCSGSWMISRSSNSARRKGFTSSVVLGPPRFIMTMPVGPLLGHSCGPPRGGGAGAGRGLGVAPVAGLVEGEGGGLGAAGLGVVVEGPAGQRRHRHQDRLDVPARLQPEQGPAVVDEVELDVAAAPQRLPAALALAVGRRAAPLDDRQVGGQQRRDAVLDAGEVGFEVVRFARSAEAFRRAATKRTAA
jgi:hypothetical protein